MNEYVFLYRGGERATSPELVQQILQKWYAWFQTIEGKDRLVARGQPLDPTGKVVNAKRVVVDGPFAEAKDLVGGYSLVKAASIEEASELAKGCPLLERGGQVEVRPVMKM